VTDTYPPTTENNKVPVGFDVALLPPLPEGDSEDADLGGNPSPAPPSARTPSAPTTSGTEVVATSGATSPESGAIAAPQPDVEFIDAPGAHAPTAAQRDATKTIWLKH
jgi:hypothetical protein